MKKTNIAVAVLAALLASCQYKAEPLTVATYNVYSSYEGKLPGKYLLFVDGSKLDKSIKPSDYNCAAHTFPLALSGSFSGSVRQTFTNLVTELEVVQAPVGRDELKSRGARGMIIVKGEDVNARLRVVPGFWVAGMETEVEIAASITVDGQSGRLLGTTVSGDGNGQSDAGLACEGGAKSLTQSAEQAMKETLGRLGEALTNSERVRTGK
ncbi:hypothetical protein ATN81_18920 [Agrobacterium pusense]|uniref:hypothetical protein n=1 Tax=Agrobacterium pusense TaxID=648995 RepID=UPI00092C4862|nr:hypothetical protein [Agrobacterium pusense]OJH53463.1 hypothetical protein ATN81_18920 [Agrobacterium pusense]OJH57772.1 hypothetical protein BA725_20825 [Agrobacterium pusense]